MSHKNEPVKKKLKKTNMQKKARVCTRSRVGSPCEDLPTPSPARPPTPVSSLSRHRSAVVRHLFALLLSALLVAVASRRRVSIFLSFSLVF